jgi:putative transposase
MHTTERVGSLPTWEAVAPESTRFDTDPWQTVRTEDKVVFQCGYDVVWCTQYRSPVITDQIKQRLLEIIAEVVEEKGAQITGMEISPVYIRMMVDVSPRFGIHRLVKAIKTRSATALRTEFPSLRSRLPSLWTNSYLVTTLGSGAQTSMIQQYVDGQKTRAGARG